MVIGDNEETDKEMEEGGANIVFGGLELVFASKLVSNPTLLSNSTNTMPSAVKQLLPVNSLFLVTVNEGMAAPTGKLLSQK